jgi:polysaccharide export outer membrane protein
MIRFAVIIGLALASALLVSCASSESNTPWTQPIPAALEAADTRPVDYRVGALDLLEVKVFQIDDLQRTVRVDQNGEVTLPLIGPVRASGRTVGELETEIARLYSENYLQNPRVSVFVKEYASQRIAVTGAVVQPGMFTLDAPTSLLGAVSLARGPNDIASYEDVAIIRTANGRREGSFHNLDRIIAGKEEDPRVLGGDIVVVQRSGLRQTMQEVMSFAPLLSIIPLL